MKTKLIMLMLMGFIIMSCSKTEKVVNEGVDCEALGEWNGYVPGCGCYGYAMGLNGKCILRDNDTDPYYFGKGNFKYIHDSIAFTFDFDQVSIIYLDDKGGVGSKSIGKLSTSKDIFSDNFKYASITFRARDWYTPPAIEGLYTEIVIEKAAIKSAPEEITFKAYHWSGNTKDAVILDSTTLVVKKDMKRL